MLGRVSQNQILIQHKELLTNPIVQNIANKYNKTSAQVILKWHTQKGFIVIPGSENVKHIKDNIDIYHFELTTEDMNQIDSLNKGERRYNRTKEALVNFTLWQPHFEVE